MDGTGKAGKNGNGLAGFLRVLGTLLMVAAILVLAAFQVPKLLGYHEYSVVSGSMEPAIPVGSMVFVKDCEPAELSEGDVIAFEYRGETVVHRIVKNDTASGTVRTKGDANEVNDMSPVPYESVIGVVARSVPHLGSLGLFLSGLVGKLCALAVILAGVLFRTAGTRMMEE